MDKAYTSILEKDLEDIVKCTLPFEDLNGSSVLVTGATGLIGVSLIRSLIALNRFGRVKCNILGIARNAEKAKRIYGELLTCDFFKLIYADIREKMEFTDGIDYIFHCASITSSKTMVEKPVETIMTSLIGTRNMLELAIDKEVKSFVYVSSMEMYGTFENIKHNITENDLGYINPLHVRSNYPESKRMCENMCIAYKEEYKVPVKIARLSQTFGAGILPGENRVFAQFAKSVINNEDIVLHTKGLSEGNYCYICDTIKGLFTILLKGLDGEAYNVSNPEAHKTIVDMAKMVCQKIANDRIKVVFDIPESNVFGYAADTKMKLSSSKLQQLGWKPEIGLEESYRRMIADMLESKN